MKGFIELPEENVDGTYYNARYVNVKQILVIMVGEEFCAFVMPGNSIIKTNLTVSEIATRMAFHMMD